MAFMPPSSYVKQIWRTADVSRAIELSAEAMMTMHCGHDSASEFLSKHGIKNLFLMGTDSQLPDCFEVLVESSGVGERWGTRDMIVDLSQIADETVKLQWLHSAANFGGSLYLMNLSFSQEEASAWWDALCCAHTGAPTSLFFLLDFRVYGATSKDFDTQVSARALMGTLRHNHNIGNLAVFRSNLEFSGDCWELQDISLNTLHLEGVTVGQSFIETFANLESPPITNTLTLVCCQFIMHCELSYALELFIFSKVLKWQLQNFTFAGFATKINLIAAMQQLKICRHSSLFSLSLDDASEMPPPRDLRKGDRAIIGAVVDALHSSGLPFLYLGGLEKDAAIQAQLSRNRQAYVLKHLQHNKVPADAVRLLVCGDAYAGKTTLLSTLSSLCSPTGILDRAKAYLVHQGSPQRTGGIGVRTIMRDEIRLSLWDMAGQTEFHAFYDHMFSDPGTSHGTPAMFMFVWSPIDSKDQGLGKIKQEHEFEASFRYWLKFITSKTRQSNILRKLIVVLTRKDQTQFVKEALGSSIHTLTTTFSEIIHVVEVVEVNARSRSSVKPLASCIFQTARGILEGVEVYSVCNKISKFLSSKHTQESLVRKQPIITWDDFSNLCDDIFGVADRDVLKAIACSLNESGDIIYLSNLPFLVLDPNWFCRAVLGILIRFPERQTPKATIPTQGYANQAFLEKVLKESSQCSIIQGSLLLSLMEAMHLCCKVPGDTNGRVFVPATLSLEVGGELHWRGLSAEAITGKSVYGYAYVGRRLECDKKYLTFLTPGLFPTIQVLFSKAFCESRLDVKFGKADVKLGKNFISICVQDMEIILEWGLAKGEHVIDVMVRAPDDDDDDDDDDADHTLAYVHDEIIKTVISVCAQPVGNQGVRLVEGVIRPDCLQLPAPLHAREDQCVSILDLKQELKEQLEGGWTPEKLLHLWEGNRCVTNRFIDLLGCKEYMEVLMSYKSSLQEASLMSFTATGGGLMQASTASHIASKRVVDSEGTSTASQGKNPIRDVADHKWMTELSPQIDTGEKDQPYELAASKTMARRICCKMQSMKAKLDGARSSVDSTHQDIHTKLDAIHGSIIELRSREVPKIQRMVEQSLTFTVQNEARRIPRFGFLTTGDAGVRRRMVRVLFKGLKHVRIELFCEHREGPHRVDGQEGISVSTMGEAALLKKALPYVNRFLKVLNVVAKVGARVFAGASSAVPDLSQLIALALDTPGFLDDGGVLVNLSTSPDDDYSGWQQWLVSVLETNGGMTESNIARKFMLRHARYKDTSKVAWLCGRHYKEQCPLPLVL